MIKGIESAWHPCTLSRSRCVSLADYADEPDRRLELLHDNVKKYGTVFDTVAPART